MDYRWDDAKAKSNLEKHGIDFADSISALEDEFSLSFADPDSHGEERFVGLGMDAQGRLLITVFAPHDEHIRIISARKATRNERRRYEEI